MVKVFLSILTNFKYFFTLLLEYRKTKTYAKSLIQNTKKEFPEWSVVIDRANERRMWDYILIQTLWASGFNLLRGNRLADNERKAIINLSALAPLYDDFFDKVDKPAERIHFLVNHPAALKEGTTLEKIFARFSLNVQQDVRDVDLYLNEAQNVFKAQHASKRLVADEKLAFEAIQSISYHKGVATVLCMGNMLNNPLSANEVKVMEKLGGLAQFLDDVFDFKDDFDEGRQTLINNELPLQEVKLKFIQAFQDFKRELKASGYTYKQQKSFLLPVALLGGATITCFNQYERLEKKYGTLDLSKISREALICDMDVYKNRLDAIKKAKDFLNL